MFIFFDYKFYFTIVLINALHTYIMGKFNVPWV